MGECDKIQRGQESQHRKEALLHDADPNQRPGKETKDESGRSDAKTSNATNKRLKDQRSMKHKGEQRRGKRKK